MLIRISFIFFISFLSALSHAQDYDELTLETLWESASGLDENENKALFLQQILSDQISKDKPLCEETPLLFLTQLSDKPAKLFKTSINSLDVSKKYVLYTEDIIAESITLFVQQDTCWQSKSFGRTLEQNESLKSPFPNLIINLPSGLEVFYLLHQDTKSIRPWVGLQTEEKFHEINNANLYLMGHYNGIYTILVIAGLLMFLWQKSRITLFYFIYALSCQFYGYQILGLGTLTFSFWPGAEYFKLMQTLAVSFIIAGIALVTIEFLKIKGKLGHLIKIGVLLTCCSFIISYWIPTAYLIGALFLLPISVITFSILLHRFKHGGSAIKWFSVGLMASVFGGGIQAFSIINQGSDVSSLSGFAFIIGSLIESTIWLFAIALRLRNDRRRIEDKLIFDATHDPLTGFGNRSLLSTKLDHCIKQINNEIQSQRALLFVSLDRFKYVNDSLGHSFGDKVLIKASRLINQLTDHGEVFRFAGDKFVILMNKRCTQSDVVNLSQTINHSIENSLKIDSVNLHLSTNTGIVMIDDPNQFSEDILRDADIALYHAKIKHIDRYCLYEKSMHEFIFKRFSIEQAITSAIDDDQFEMHYQPIVDIQTEKTIGFESLIRWNHPEKGFIRPDEFIPIAEETGHIIKLGAWILKTVIMQVGEWKQQNNWGDGFYVTINISGIQLSDENLLSLFKENLSKHHVSGSDIRIELTETAVIANKHIADKILPLLNEQGIRLCMDDFGSGYSSLSYLNEMNFDVLKIDRSFIIDIERKESSRTMVRTVVAMAKEMGMVVVAEGIEDHAQNKILQSLNCDFGQGYLYAKPMDAASVTQLIQS